MVSPFRFFSYAFHCLLLFSSADFLHAMNSGLELQKVAASINTLRLAVQKTNVSPIVAPPQESKNLDQVSKQLTDYLNNVKSDSVSIENFQGIANYLYGILIDKPITGYLSSVQTILQRLIQAYGDKVKFDLSYASSRSDTEKKAILQILQDVKGSLQQNKTTMDLKTELGNITGLFNEFAGKPWWTGKLLVAFNVDQLISRLYKIINTSTLSLQLADLINIVKDLENNKREWQARANDITKLLNSAFAREYTVLEQLPQTESSLKPILRTINLLTEVNKSFGGIEQSLINKYQQLYNKRSGSSKSTTTPSTSTGTSAVTWQNVQEQINNFSNRITKSKYPISIFTNAVDQWSKNGTLDAIKLEIESDISVQNEVDKAIKSLIEQVMKVLVKLRKEHKPVFKSDAKTMANSVSQLSAKNWLKINDDWQQRFDNQLAEITKIISPKVPSSSTPTPPKKPIKPAAPSTSLPDVNIETLTNQIMNKGIGITDWIKILQELVTYVTANEKSFNFQTQNMKLFLMNTINSAIRDRINNTEDANALRLALQTLTAQGLLSKDEFDKFDASLTDAVKKLKSK